jgi:hypothetical protein
LCSITAVGLGELTYRWSYDPCRSLKRDGGKFVD